MKREKNKIKANLNQIKFATKEEIVHNIKTLELDLGNCQNVNTRKREKKFVLFCFQFLLF